ncbi:MAG: A/G-specific adenine glycosylase [Chitinophagales bacterium]|nr:A/G-specific adenine glycosylase [Chitinophagales bacterium]
MAQPSYEHLPFFNQQLVRWLSEHPRPLPWKGEKDPYLIWLSEIILQQTRVEQGMPYFHHFKATYPSVQHLADASEDEVMKSWQGLGYYSRARNLHAAAKFIAYEQDGQFPNTYDHILQLKGVGPYTAAAIASFAYELPHAVVDGNVFRVLSRFWGIQTPIDTTPGKKQYKALAQQLLEENEAAPSVHNQAMMDFGATHCTPQKPLCSNCPMQSKCMAYNDGLVNTLPIKSKRIKKRKRYFNFLVIKQEGKVLLQKRSQKDIWQQLYQFPLIESEQPIKKESEMHQSSLWQQLLGEQETTISQIAGPFKQTLTHQFIIAHFWEISLKADQTLNYEGFVKANQKNLSKFAFPKIIDCYFQDNSLYLKLL